MKKSKIFLAIILVSSYSSVFAADSFNARSMALGGTSVAAGGLGVASVSPAMTGSFDEDDDFGTRINFGIEASDPDSFLDEIDVAKDEIDVFQSKIDAGTAAPGDEDAALDAIKSLQGKVVDLGVGLDFQAAIPGSYLGAAVFVVSSARIGIDFSYDDADETNVILGQDSLESSVRSSGYGITEAGVSLSHTIEDLSYGTLTLGVAPKYQRVDLIDYEASVSAFETSDIRDDMVEETGFNADLGALYSFGENSEFAAGLVIRNLVSADVEGKSGETFKIRPVPTAGFSYDNGWISSSFEIDGAKTYGYGLIKDSQFARAGVEIDAFRWAQIRFGYRDDISGGREDVVSAGLGISPFNVVNIDLAGLYGKNDTYGVALQIGARF
jgi:hypothetical protein